MSSTEIVARDWLKALGSLTAGTIAPKEAEARLGAYASLIVKEFPIAAFSAQSLAAVARQCKFFPSYGELCGYLSEWWRENRPAPAALPAPNGPGTHGFWEGRYAAMRREWDDPAGIRERVRVCKGEEQFLGPLRALVQRWAPQHLSVVPPAPERFSKPEKAASVRPAVMSFPMTDAELLVEYERLAKLGNQAAATRARMLRARLEPAS